ncbi:TPA: type IV secretion system protein [Burkholderia contaminans]|uniref:type IV secretion system protein n=1 Tax=Burkholderia TaxID=32008 RepID=UPI00075953FF|nr:MULTISPECIES: type IV secretion system protein [Burkholderia]KVS31260.1 type VI secretion protein [Burkholderia vietnamiensis]MBM6430626.1 type IV secretion system protein [Burkholderia contaminans]MBR8016137.1 type IV secretion system protein [Burkholderia vietnamiensis]MCA7881083.1 type IV secretion system protein [Burkholderia contaminans]MCB4348880.1 type IV secretion system protein [Burkholderia vietnamiensis]
MRFPRLFPRSKKQVALSPAPGFYSNEDPEQIIFDQSTRLRVEANHWKTFCFLLAIVAGGAVYTRNPAPSVVKAYGVSSDAGGNPIVTQLTSYKPDDQAKRKALRETVERWFTIEPVLTDDIQSSRMARNINAVKQQMTGNARNQFADWLKTDAPFQQITTNPKLVRESRVTNVSLLEDSTAIVEFTTSTTQMPSDKPVVVRYALTVRYQIVAPTQEDALGNNPFGVYYPFWTLQKTAA